MMKFKECSTCKLELPICSFYKDNNKSYGVRSQCKKCVEKYIRKIKPKEEQKVINVAYYIIDNKATYNETAKHFNICSRTVDRYVKLLLDISLTLRNKVRRVTKHNKIVHCRRIGRINNIGG